MPLNPRKIVFVRVPIYQADSYSEDETDGSHPGGGHDFGTVGDQVEQDGHGGLGSMVEAAAEHRRQVSETERRDVSVSQNLLSGTEFMRLASHPRVMQASLTT